MRIAVKSRGPARTGGLRRILRHIRPTGSRPHRCEPARRRRTDSAAQTALRTWDPGPDCSGPLRCASAAPLSVRGTLDRPHRTPPEFHAPPASFPRFSALRERRGRRSRYLYPRFCAPAPIFSGPALRASAAPAPASLRTGILCVSAPEPPPLRNYRLNRGFCGPDCRIRNPGIPGTSAAPAQPPEGRSAVPTEPPADAAAASGQGAQTDDASCAAERNSASAGTDRRRCRIGRPPVPQGAKRALGRSIARPSPNGRGRPK